ncbi:DMT family transporter [Lachnospiraceae bacterium NSJ-143]|nr:DMT family transporter [Lachnospiraceae bacterium NSJ-143]
MNEKSVKLKGTVFALIGGACWGFSGTCGQFLFSIKSINTEWLTAVRMLSAGIIMVIMALFTQRDNIKGILSSKIDRLALLVFGIMGLMLCQYTYFAAIANSNAATATVLQYLGPALIMVYVCLRSLRLPNIKEITAIILAVTGTFLLATHGNISSLTISPAGLSFGLLSAVTLAVYTLMPGKLIARWGSLTVTGLGMLVAGVAFTLFSRAWTIHQNIDIQSAFIVILIIMIGTVLPFTLYLKGVSYIGASKASVFACIEPVSATFFSAVWLKSKFTPMDLLGFSFIIATVLMLSLKDFSSEKLLKRKQISKILN